ncbi:uncharacterized protein LOC129788359 [Lutzomyia longipalpis]|uniref:uncharacterized protein LOC129788359 n=1 Tax=Lutzomyia longipalpis TaxID=7200 RepID=UPI002483F909|nr:uncharacterized protein LOC129788359 [Lutzomyia longipalpis]
MSVERAEQGGAVPRTAREAPIGGPGGSFFGTIEPFVPEEGNDFEDYLERMDHLLAFNGVAEDSKKCSAFIFFVGNACVKKLKAAIQPDPVTSLTYKQMKDILKEKFMPKKSVTAERFKFYGRKQEEGESITDYVSELQLLASSCKFGQFLKEALRDKLVCGVRSSRIQARLLDEDKNFDQTLKLAIAMELSEENVKMMKPAKTVAAIKKSSQKEKNFAPKGKSHGGNGNSKRGNFSDSKLREYRQRDESTDRRASKRRNRSPIKCFRCGNWGNHVAAECTVGKKSKRERRGERANKRHLRAIQDSDDEISTESSYDSDRMGEKVQNLRLGSVIREAKFQPPPLVSANVGESVSIGYETQHHAHDGAWSLSFAETSPIFTTDALTRPKSQHEGSPSETPEA